MALPSEYPAQHLAANLGGAGFVVRHDAARRRQDRDAEPVIDPRQVDELGINPPAWLGEAGDLADHRLPVDIFQFDLSFGGGRTDLLSRESQASTLAAP